MTARWFMGLALVAVLAGCSGSDRADTVDAPPPTTTPIAAASPTQSAPTTEPDIDPGVLSRILLELSDMPAGWAVQAQTDDEDDSDDVCGPLPELKKPKNEAGSSFGASAFGPLVLQSTWLWSTGDARSHFDAIVKHFKDCGSTWTDPSDPTQVWTVAPLSFPKLGDETFSARLTTNTVPLFGVAQADFVAFRKGPVMELMIYVAIGPAVAAPSPLEGLGERAEEKLTKAGIR